MAQATLTIDRSDDDVFAVLSDVEKTPIWSSAAVEEHWTSEGPVGVGSTRRAVGRSFGVRSENETVVTDFEPNQKLGLKSVSSPVPFQIAIMFEPIGQGTRIDWVQELKPEGFYRLVIPLFFKAGMRVIRRDLETLKELLEAGTL